MHALDFLKFSFLTVGSKDVVSGLGLRAGKGKTFSERSHLNLNVLF